MTSDKATALVIEIAKDFITLVRGIEPKWLKAYLRFSSHDAVYGANASYVHSSGVDLIDSFKYGDFFASILEKGQALLTSLEKQKGVLLLIADSNFNYEIKFEYEDMNRWRINKLDGASGVPEGIES